LPAKIEFSWGPLPLVAIELWWDFFCLKTHYAIEDLDPGGDTSDAGEDEARRVLRPVYRRYRSVFHWTATRWWSCGEIRSKNCLHSPGSPRWSAFPFIRWQLKPCSEARVDLFKHLRFGFWQT
jgi:hypothetical protein